MNNYYYKNHFDDFKALWILLKRINPYIFLLFFLLSISLGFFVYLDLFKNIIELASKTNQNSIILILKAKYHAYISLFEWLIAIISIVGIYVWSVSAMLLYILLKIIVGYIYQIFYKVDYKHLKRSGKYYIILRKKAGKYHYTLLSLILLIALIIFCKMDIAGSTLDKIIHTYGLLLLFFTPFVFTTSWIFYLKIRKKRILNNKNIKIDDYLFSQNSIRLRFKNILVVLLFLGIIGTIYLPFYFASVNSLANHYSYKIVKKVKLDLDKYSQNIDKENLSKFLDKEWLATELNTLHPLSRVDNYNKYIPLLQNYFFLIIILGGLFEIGIPVISRAVLFDNAKNAIIKVFLITFKSFLVVLFISLLIKKAYFIDISEPFGIGIIFSFLMTFFLALDSEPSLKEEEE